MRKLNAFFTLIIAFGVTASIANAQDTSAMKRQFDLSENGNKVATVTMERTDQTRTIQIERENGPVHVYRSFISAPLFSVHVGKRRLFTYTYDSEIGRIDADKTSFLLNEVRTVERHYGRRDVSKIHQQVAEDMRILRAVREYEPYARIFETALVIATGSDSILRGEAQDSLRVNERVEMSRQSLFSARIVRVSTVLQSYTACIDNCKNTESRCVASVPEANRIQCYQASFNCQQNSDNVYGGGTPRPPRQPVQP